MNIAVIKFGGSSIADDNKLREVAQKTIEFIEKGKKVVVILSAQGKTTDDLIGEAEKISLHPNKRELDMLVSVGEQKACSKFAILLNELGYSAVSMLGWQAGILTDSNFTQAIIEEINTERIYEKLDNNQVVIIAGFQGIDKNKNITTLGRNGSDITALAISAALEQKECYIFTDTDGVYDKDPHQFEDAQKLDNVTYEDMKKLAQNGAKVLHERCVKIAEKYDIKIIVKSAFNNNDGTIICKS